MNIRLEDLREKHLGKRGSVDIGFGETASGRITDFYGILEDNKEDAKVLIEFDDKEYYILDAETIIEITS